MKHEKKYKRQSSENGPPSVSGGKGYKKLDRGVVGERLIPDPRTGMLNPRRDLDPR